MTLEFFTVNQFQVAMSTGRGANGVAGLNVPSPVEAESGCAGDSVITPPTRAAEESVWERENSRGSATHTRAQARQHAHTHTHTHTRTHTHTLTCRGVTLFCVSSVDSAPWYDWSSWSQCTVSCGGGEQSRTRSCQTPPCTGLKRQSKTCNTQVCLGKSQGNFTHRCAWVSHRATSHTGVLG